MFRTALLFVCLFSMLPAPLPVHGATVVKLAAVTPEGSTWTRLVHEFADAVHRETGGAVEFKIYAGGVSGDEIDVLRKMRVNRIDAAGFSGVALGVLVPEIRILEAPLLFENYGELDHVKTALFDTFAAAFEKRGMVLLGFAEAGFVYFFADTGLAGDDALGSVRMWAWKGDPVARTFLETFGVRTYPLDITDVNTGLETGMINAFYAPPLAAVAFQWYTRVRFMLDFPMVNSTGALLMTRRTFDRLSAGHQEILRRLAREYGGRLVRAARRNNAEARDLLKASGIELVRPTRGQIADFEANARKTYERSIPDLYSRDLLSRVQELLDDYRARHSED